MSSEVAFPFVRLPVARPVRDDELEYALANDFEPWFFTFGAGQAFPNHCVCIWASSEDRARLKMNDLFGGKWSFCYDLEHIVDYKKRWDIRLVGEYCGD